MLNLFIYKKLKRNLLPINKWVKISFAGKVYRVCNTRLYTIDSDFNDQYLVRRVLIEEISSSMIDSLIIFKEDNWGYSYLHESIRDQLKLF